MRSDEMEMDDEELEAAEEEIERRAAKRQEHVVMGDGGINCLRCGEHYRYNFQAPIPIWEFTAIAAGFGKEHENCEPDPERVAARYKYATPQEWLDSWDTGSAGRTIFNTFTRTCFGAAQTQGTPDDPDAFRRCCKLLAAPFAAGWSDKLEKVAERFPLWAPFVAAWPELRALLDEEMPGLERGDAPKLRERLKAMAPHHER